MQYQLDTDTCTNVLVRIAKIAGRCVLWTSLAVTTSAGGLAWLTWLPIVVTIIELIVHYQSLTIRLALMPLLLVAVVLPFVCLAFVFRALTAETRQQRLRLWAWALGCTHGMLALVVVVMAVWSQTGMPWG